MTYPKPKQFEPTQQEKDEREDHTSCGSPGTQKERIGQRIQLERLLEQNEARFRHRGEEPTEQDNHHV